MQRYNASNASQKKENNYDELKKKNNLGLLKLEAAWPSC